VTECKDTQRKLHVITLSSRARPGLSNIEQLISACVSDCYSEWRTINAPHRTEATEGPHAACVPYRQEFGAAVHR
jgi:hypothetical protein